MRRSDIYNIVAWGLAAVLQVTFLGALRIGGIEPNLIVAVLVMTIVFATDECLLWYGVASGGIVLELFSSLHFGLILLSLILIASFIMTIQRRFLHEASVLAVVAFAIVAGVIYDCVIALSSGLLTHLGLVYIAGDALYTGFLTLVLVGLLYSVAKRFFHNDVLIIKRDR